ncbi:MAG: methionine aminotransferase [Bacteroidia bacterium]|nr:methionine aminotransferase [Bacteroidia bacterium]
MPKLNFSLNSKLPGVGVTIFTVMTEKAKECQAINLAQGFPDFPCDPLLSQLVYDSMRRGENQYAPMPGLLSLREQIAQAVERWYGVTYHPETEITITSGATEAIFDAIVSMVHPEQEVIVLEPCYDSYIPAIELAGGIPIYIPLKYPDYSIDWAAVQKRINQRTRLIIINSPHNPTGTTLSEDDMMMLSKITKNTNIVIISDEVYEHILFDGKSHTSVCKYPELANRSFVISSFGKSLHITGWKIGYCLAPVELTKEFRKVHQYVTFSSSTPFQQAIADYLQQKPNFAAELKDFYEEKRNYFLKLLSGSKFEALPCRGTYFQLLNYRKLSNEEDTKFAIQLTETAKVASIPVSVFYHKHTDDKVLRFCFAK